MPQIPPNLDFCHIWPYSQIRRMENVPMHISRCWFFSKLIFFENPKYPSYMWTYIQLYVKHLALCAGGYFPYWVLGSLWCSFKGLPIGQFCVSWFADRQVMAEEEFKRRRLEDIPVPKPGWRGGAGWRGFGGFLETIHHICYYTSRPLCGWSGVYI